MEQQKGMKRASKVLTRKRKLKVNAKSANLRRLERAVEVADKEKSEKAK